MKLYMSGLEHSAAPIALREKLSFTRLQAGEAARGLLAAFPLSGCVLLSTCNRTELYVTGGQDLDPGRLLCRAAGVEDAPCREALLTLEGRDAARHLLEVAAGLRSRIWGEDQIISQVKEAIAVAREAGAADPALETLFRCAVAAGKEVRTRARLTAVPTSAASRAVALLEDRLGSLAGKRALVIGNGEMGRLSATLLEQAGCRVTVTLRSYRHGETVVPPGCGVIPYDRRLEGMEGADLLLSATTSPHYTVTVEQLKSLASPPALLVDLAIPRDIQPQAGDLPGVALFNVDDLGDLGPARAVPPQVEAILAAQLENFYRWVHYKGCMASVDSLKEALVARLLTARELEEDLGPEELIRLSVGKAVDLLVGGLAQEVTPEGLARCEGKIRARTTGAPRAAARRRAL